MRVAAWLLLLLNARATTIWPAPAHMHAGNGIVAVSSDAEWRLSHPHCATLRAAVERYRALSASREQQRKELLSQVAASAPSPSKRPRTPARRRGGAPVGFRA